MKHVLLALGIYHPATHRGVAQYAKEHGWLLDSRLAFRRTLPRAWDGDGILVNSFMAPEFLDLVLEAKKPTVYVGHCPPGVSYPAVDTSQREEARLAYGHFAERGFRSFATYTDRVREHSECLQVFQEMCAEDHHPCRSIRAIESRGCAELLAHIHEGLRECALPVAVFCRDDNAAVELLHACLMHGLAVPEQVAIVGTRNDPLVCETAPIPLSSVAIDYEGIGYRAAELLDRAMAGEDVPVGEISLTPTGVVTRQSSEILAYPHEGLVAALGYIRQNFHTKLSVRSVASFAGMSERGLHHAFRTHLCRTVQEEIVRVRLAHAEDMLATGNEKIDTIAQESGFGDRRRLHAHFVRAHGQTPRQYRYSRSQQ